MFGFFRDEEAREKSPESGAAEIDPPAKTVETDDLLAGFRDGAREVNQRLIHAIKNERGLHLGSFFVALGSLAGFSCQASLRGERGALESRKVVRVTEAGVDEKKFYSGALLEKLLVGDGCSIWNLAATAARSLNATVPEVDEIVRHVEASMGESTFGVPRVPDRHRAAEAPVHYLREQWPLIFPVAAAHCSVPAQWPVLFGVAIQEAVFMAKEVIDPGLAVTIAMESAIPMSKVDIPEFSAGENFV